MIFKLAFRNMRKSMSDYAVYFVTLIIGISIFYVFNAISDQTVMIKIFKNEYDILDLMASTLSVASVIVSAALAFLIVYASSFLMKRRKKEFGIYMLLGMGKKKIAGVLMAETVIIGILSLVVGMGVGIILSQGMSVLVASLFEADMSKFTFDVSVKALGKTLLYFLIMYVLVLILDVFVVGKSRLINLLNAERKTEKNTAKNPWICLVVFVVAVAVLSHAYWMVTANAEQLTEQSQVLTQIVKGIIATFLIFWSLSGLLIFLAKLRKKSYMKGINTFTTKEISSRVNTNVFAGSIICLLLFITICIFSTCFSINKSMNDNLKTLVPVDVTLEGVYDPGLAFDSVGWNVSEVLQEEGIDANMFEDVVEIVVYDYYKYDEKENMCYYDQENIFTNPGVVRVSDYNKMARIFGLEQHALEEDEYMVISNYDYSREEYKRNYLQKGRVIRLGGKEYHPKYKECQDGFLRMSSNRSELGFTVVPDHVAADENLHPGFVYYIANYNKNYSKSVEQIDKFVNGEKFKKKMNDLDIVVTTRTEIHQRSIGLTVLIVFLGLYLGIIFVIASSALLSLKELSQAADSREKYRILRKIGVDEKMIHRSLFRQNLIFFAMPLLLAVIHSIFGIQVCIYIMEIFGKTGLLYSIIFTAAVLLVIYTIYFVITYRCSRKIIDE